MVTVLTREKETPMTAFQEITALAKRLVADGAAATLEQGFAKACDERPDLAAQAREAERQARR
jgi:hypothetical protein